MSPRKRNRRRARRTPRRVTIRVQTADGTVYEGAVVAWGTFRYPEAALTWNDHNGIEGDD